jgi:alkylation response protein AidB-like acyl-CoA dehydrogenase
MTVGLLPVLSDEQEMLVDASARFMDTALPLSAVRARSEGTDGSDTSYAATAGELGWFGLLAGEAHGGGSVSGNGVVDAAVVGAERGARLQPGPFAGHGVFVHTLSNAFSAARADLLTDLITGAALATWAFGSEATCSVRAADGGLRLDGEIEVIADVGDCRHLLVTATGPDGLVQFLLPVDAPGITVREIDGFDVTRRWYGVSLDAVPIAPDAVIGAPGAPTEALVARQAQLAGVLTAAEAVGAMHADFEIALQYSKDRIAFGRPIGSFQSIKHLLADTSLWLEMSKGLVAAAASAFGSGAPVGPELAHAAKAFVAERSVELAHNCFQVFGGIGYTWEHDQHLFLRRLSADAVCFGSAAWHRSQLLDAAGVGS